MNKPTRKPKRAYKKQPREFEQKVVEISRVTRVTGGGKRMRFRALVVIGNKKGKVGIGLKKGGDVQEAVNKAVDEAKKNMITVPLINETIPHEVKVKFKASQIIMLPASPGTGVIAGGAVRSILDVAGVNNVISKMLGSNSKINNVRAAFEAFKSMRSKEEILNTRK